MAKTQAEIQRAYRERKKAQAKAEKAKPLPTLDPIMSVPIQSFASFFKEHESNIMFPENLDWVGVEVHTNLSNENLVLERAADWTDLELPINSLNVASAMVGIFIDAAKELAELINAYKLEEIDRQMQNASPVKRGQLEALEKRLGKKTSHFFPVIE